MLGLERTRTTNFDFDERANMRGPRAQHHDLIGKKHGFADIMRDKNHRLPGAGPDLGQFNLEFFTRLRVNRGKGFIEEQYIGIDGKSASEIGTLLHSAGQFRRMAMLKPRKPTRSMSVCTLVVPGSFKPLCNFKP